MKFDTCAVRVSLSQVWAVSWAWKMWKVHVQKEQRQQQQRTMKGRKGREGKEAKLQWMKNQLGACNFENALGGLSWLTDWMNDLTARTTDCWLLNCRLQTGETTDCSTDKLDSLYSNNAAGETHVRLSENHAATAKKYIAQCEIQYWVLRDTLQMLPQYNFISFVRSLRIG